VFICIGITGPYPLWVRAGIDMPCFTPFSPNYLPCLWLSVYCIHHSQCMYQHHHHRHRHTYLFQLLYFTLYNTNITSSSIHPFNFFSSPTSADYFRFRAEIIRSSPALLLSLASSRTSNYPLSTTPLSPPDLGIE
jgi:hypothetical protein